MSETKPLAHVDVAEAIRRIRVVHMYRDPLYDGQPSLCGRAHFDTTREHFRGPLPPNSVWCERCEMLR